MKIINKYVTAKAVEEHCVGIINRLKNGESSLEKESVFNGKFLAVIDVNNYKINKNMLQVLVRELNVYNKFLSIHEKYSNFGYWQDWGKVEDFLLEY